MTTHMTFPISTTRRFLLVTEFVRFTIYPISRFCYNPIKIKEAYRLLSLGMFILFFHSLP